MVITANYTVDTIEVGTASPDLAPLAGRAYQSQYTSLPNANLPKAMRQSLDKVFVALTGEELPLEENTFLIKAIDGVYSRLFGPVLKAGAEGVEGTTPGSLFIQWGSRFIPIGLGKEGVTVNGVSLEAEFSEFNFSGRGNDRALLISVEKEDGSGQIVMPIAVRFIDYQNQPDVKVLNSLLKKDKASDIISMLEVATQRGGGSGGRSADHEVNMRDLDEDTKYTVISYRECQTSYGANYRLVLADTPVAGETSECWAHASLRPMLATAPEITPEHPATLTIKEKTALQDGKVRLRCSMILSKQTVVSEDDLDLNF